MTGKFGAQGVTVLTLLLAALVVGIGSIDRDDFIALGSKGAAVGCTADVDAARFRRRLN